MPSVVDTFDAMLGVLAVGRCWGDGGDVWCHDESWSDEQALMRCFDVRFVVV